MSEVILKFAKRKTTITRAVARAAAQKVYKTTNLKKTKVVIVKNNVA